MRVALVFNPFKYKIHEENLRVVQKYFGLFPPLSLAWVAAIAEEAGHDVIIIDARTLDLSQEDVYERLTVFKPDILGFMMTTYMFPDTLDWIRFLKKRLNVPVMIGGYNLRVYPIASLSHKEIDFGCFGHAIDTVPHLLRELEAGTNRFADVEGLIYKVNGEVRANIPENINVNFNRFPFPARHLLPNDLYAEFPTQRKNFTVMVTSLGCPRQCEFCEAGGTPFSPRDPMRVVDEMEECYQKYHVREIDIFDYDFTVVRSRVEKICREIIQRKLDIHWACRSRIDSVDFSLLTLMKKAGCRRMYFGIESGCQRILDTVNKGISLEQIEKTIALCHVIGIQTLGFFLIGAPGDTYETVQETIRFAKKLDLDYMQFSKCLAKPLTPLWKKMVVETGFDYWKEWILGNETDKLLPRPWTELTNEEIDSLAHHAYVACYANPIKLIKATLQVRSWREFVKKVRAFFDMVIFQEKISKMDMRFKTYNENAKKIIRDFSKNFIKNKSS